LHYLRSSFAGKERGKEMIVDSSFVGKDFYVNPPETNNPEDWDAWLKADASKARQAKAAYTRSQKHSDRPAQYQERTLRKVNGKWSQGTLTSFQGSAEDNTLALEAGMEADQEHHLALVNMELTRHKRGGSRKGKSARRRANRKARG
jgi:hypothetical protein